MLDELGENVKFGTIQFDNHLSLIMELQFETAMVHRIEPQGTAVGIEPLAGPENATNQGGSKMVRNPPLSPKRS